MEINEILDSSFKTYADYVNFHRAIPHYFDGMKNVSRRILYTMYVNKWTSDKPFVKVARISGQVMGVLHPHGNSSIEGALARLAQPYHFAAPLIIGEGNFGDGLEQPPAAARYIEAKLSAYGDSFFNNIHKNTVDWEDNYDNTTKEPKFLPAPYPQLLVSPTLGIGVGKMTSIAPHNIDEVIDTTIFALSNEHFSTEELLSHLKGPDFPCGCDVVNKNDFRLIYGNGTGSFRLRARFTWEGNTLIISNFPYGVSASKVEKEIAENSAMFDYCNVVNTTAKKQELRLMFKKHKMEADDRNEYTQKLCWNTSCETTLTFQFRAIEGKEANLFSLQEFFMKWKKQHLSILKAEFTYDYDKIAHRTEQLEGLIKAISILDEVIAWIKNSDTRSSAKTKLISEGFSEIQAEYILDLKLSRLVNLEIVKIKEELNQLHIKMEELKELLSSEEALKKKAIDRIATYRTRIERQSSILNQVNSKPKKQKSSTFYLRKKGKNVFIGEEYTKDSIAVGKSNPVYVLHDNMISPITNAKEPAIINVHHIISGDQDVFHFSKDGYVKRTKVSNLQVTRKAAATKQDVFAAMQADPLHYVLITTKSGKQVQFKLEGISPTGRNTKGVMAVKLGSESIEKVEIISTPKGEVETKRGKQL